jgi:hypothetical protein
LVIGDQGVTDCYAWKGQPLPADGLDINSTVSIFQLPGYLIRHPGADLFQFQEIWGEKHNESNNYKNRDRDFSSTCLFHF